MRMPGSVSVCVCVCVCVCVRARARVCICKTMNERESISGRGSSLMRMHGSISVCIFVKPRMTGKARKQANKPKKETPHTTDPSRSRKHADKQTKQNKKDKETYTDPTSPPSFGSRLRWQRRRGAVEAQTSETHSTRRSAVMCRCPGPARKNKTRVAIAVGVGRLNVCVWAV